MTTTQFERHILPLIPAGFLNTESDRPKQVALEMLEEGCADWQLIADRFMEECSRAPFHAGVQKAGDPAWG